MALTYAEILNEQGTREAGQRAQAMLRPLLSQSGNDPVFQQRYARASELAGDSVRASEAYAEAAFLSGRPEQALLQLQALKRNPALDYIGRARLTRASNRSPRPCWSCAARVCRIRTWTGAERCMTGRWQSQPVPGRVVTNMSSNRSLLAPLQ